jgi:Zn-dependent protease
VDAESALSRMNFSTSQIITYLMSYLIVVLSLSAHEWGHAWTADRFGDDTPRREGRVTFNPLAHIDPIGTVLMPLIAIVIGFAVIGWAKPVYINPRNLPRTSQRAWVTIAGPLMNCMLALAGTLALALAFRTGAVNPNLLELLKTIIIINVSLMMFNLLPVPPLDGSKFLMYWFGMSEVAYVSFARFGWIILMLLINVPFTRALLTTLLGWAFVPFSLLLNVLT